MKISENIARPLRAGRLNRSLPQPRWIIPTRFREWIAPAVVTETGDVHGNGNLIIFTDGSIAETNNVLPK